MIIPMNLMASEIENQWEIFPLYQYFIKVELANMSAPNLPLLPVEIIVSIKNNSCVEAGFEPIVGDYFGSFNSKSYEMLIKAKDNSDWKQIKPAFHFGDIIDFLPSPIKLGPDESTTSSIILLCDQDLTSINKLYDGDISIFYFITPGHYELYIRAKGYRVKRSDPTETELFYINSNVVEIVIEKPSGNDAEILDYLKSLRHPFLLSIPEESSFSNYNNIYDESQQNELKSVLTNIIEKSNNSQYTDYAKIKYEYAKARASNNIETINNAIEIMEILLNKKATISKQYTLIPLIQLFNKKQKMLNNTADAEKREIEIKLQSYDKYFRANRGRLPN